MAGSDLLERIDERTKIIIERLDEVTAHLEKLDKAVFFGNGSKPLLERTGTLEVSGEQLKEQFAQFLTQCQECKKVVFAPKPAGKPDETSLAETIVKEGAETKRTVVVERWKFFGAIGAAAVLAIPNILALLQTASQTPKP